MPGRIYAIAWSWCKFDITNKKRAVQKLRVWKRWYERQGWKVSGRGGERYFATNPKTGEQHAAAVQTYDADTKERIFNDAYEKLKKL